MTDENSAGGLLPPLPAVTEENKPFWDSCKQNVLKLQKCSSCVEFRYPASVICPKCSSMEFSWEAVSGRGSIFSFVTYRRLYHKAFASLLPYSVAVIELDEGPRMVSRLVGVTDQNSIRCASRVKVCFEHLGGDLVLPLFEITEDQ